MNNKLKLSFAALTLMLVVGCSSNPASLDRKALSQNKVTTIDLSSSDRLTHEQSSNASNVSKFIPGGFLVGALGAGIDIAVSARRANALAAITSSLGNYNVRSVFANKLRKTAGNSIASNVSVSENAQAVTSAINSLNVNASYTLRSNHQSVLVKATVSLQPKEDAGIYKRSFTSVSNIDFASDGQGTVNATEYLKKNPNKLKQAIETALDSIVKQISDDINVGTKPVTQ